MLSTLEIGFYFQLEIDKPIYQLTCFDQFSLVDFELTLWDSSFQECFELKENNYQFDSFKELFNQLEDRISTMKFSEFHLTFENKHRLSFVNGELSASFDTKEFLYRFAVELLNICEFDGIEMFQQLSQRTNCYLEISIEDKDCFNPIALAK